MKTYEKDQMDKAIDLYFAGATQTQAVEETGVPLYAFQEEMRQRICHHPKCNETHPCRASRRRNGGLMACSALDDTNFGNGICPFFKTEKEFSIEFRATNRLSPFRRKQLGYE